MVEILIPLKSDFDFLHVNLKSIVAPTGVETCS